MQPDYFPDEQERWRNEVASRLNNYKARHGRRNIAGQYSMKLDFEAAESPAHDTAQLVAAVVEQKASHEVCDTNYYRRANQEAMGYVTVTTTSVAPDLEIYLHRYEDFLEHHPEVIEQEESRIEAQAAAAAEPRQTQQPPATHDEIDESAFAPAEAFAAAAAPAPLPPVSNVIYFPRPTIEPPLAPPPTSRNELAEPMFDKPRILDVPEDNAPTIQGPLFADIHLDAEVEDNAPVARTMDVFDVPLQVAPLSQRAFAAGCDWGIVASATAVFFLLTWKTLGDQPMSKASLAMLGLIPLGLWSIYQFLFHLYSGETPGMHLAHLRLCDFERELPIWEQRKKRALYATFSCLSVGFGFLWALVDEDTLCWHDRASHTYLSQE